MMIDVFANIVPPRYAADIDKMTQWGGSIRQGLAVYPSLGDLDSRFRIMDKYDGYLQVLTVGRSSVL